MCLLKTILTRRKQYDPPIVEMYQVAFGVSGDEAPSI